MSVAIVARRIAASVVMSLACGTLAAQPDTPPDLNRLREAAFTAERAGSHGAAADAFLSLCELEASNPDWVVRAAENLGRVGRYNDALELLDTRRKQFPDVPVLDVTLARVYHQKADAMRAEGIHDSNVVFYYQDAMRTADRVLTRDPTHLEARLIRASSQFELGDVDAALADAEIAVRDHPKAYGGHAMLGRVCFHRFVSLRQLLDETKPTGKEKAELVDRIDGNRKRASDAFEAAAIADPTRSFAFVKLGDIAAWTGRMRPALDQYGKALALDPMAKIDHGWLRTAASADERATLYRAAATAYRASEGSKPELAAVLDWYVAQTEYDRAASATSTEQRDWKPAIELFTQNLAVLPEYHDTYYYLFQAHYWNGAIDAATDVAVDFAVKAPRRFADLVREDAQTLAVLRGMAATRFRDGRLDHSRDLNQVVAFADDTADAWNNYAFLCRETRAYERSIEGYRQALVLEPDSPQLLNDAAVILQYHLPTPDNLRTAREYYTRAIERATELLGDSGLDAGTHERTRTALRDAQSNLRLLDRG